MLQIVGALILLDRRICHSSPFVQSINQHGFCAGRAHIAVSVRPGLTGWLYHRTHNPVVPYSLAGRRISDDCRNDHQLHVGT
ncbi:Uncharacterised protein [Escherichia coli]|nr:Uncharacterised protein [Escherichia coli]